MSESAVAAVGDAPRSDTTRNPSQPHLAARNLGCIRNDHWLFRRIAFDLGAGEILQVEGANGSGKTTLLRILCGLSMPDAGQVLWCGQAVEMLREAFRSELVYAGHRPAFKQGLTPLENLAAARALGPAHRALPLADALDRVGLGRLAEVPVRRLSAGQQRRVGLARLLIHRAVLWILDEPLTALDRDGRRLVERLLAEHAANGGMAVVTTHQPIDWPATAVRTLRLAP